MVATTIEKKRFTLDEYYALEARAEQKHEFHNGKIIPMAGGSIPHSKISTNLVRILDHWVATNRLPLYVLNSDTKIRIEDFNRNVYPDAVVLCEKPAYWAGRTDTIVNPVLIFEVLSDGTEQFDHSDKFKFYRSLPSFREYVMINQFQPWAEGWSRQPGEDSDLWKVNTANSLQKTLMLHSIGLEMAMSDIYFQVPELQGDKWSSD